MGGEKASDSRSAAAYGHSGGSRFRYRTDEMPDHAAALPLQQPIKNPLFTRPDTCRVGQHSKIAAQSCAGFIVTDSTSHLFSRGWRTDFRE